MFVEGDLRLGLRGENQNERDDIQRKCMKENLMKEKKYIKQESEDYKKLIETCEKDGDGVDCIYLRIKYQKDWKD